jgi:hypothetical protein
MASVRTEREQVPAGGGGQRLTGTRPPDPGPAGPQAPVWPVRTGVVPPLADGFVSRPETVPGMAAALVPGAVVALVSGHPAATGPPSRVQACGKTQLAVWWAESLWWSREVDLLAWVSATSRASVLAGYLHAAAAVGIGLDGTGEEVAARFTGWLAHAARPWLVVLDDLRDAGDLEGLWPSGPDGRVVITAPGEKILAGRAGVRVLPVGAFSPREAMKYLMERLSTDPDQRHGAMGLAAGLGGQPAALAQASAAIATSMLSCADYQGHFTRLRDQLADCGAGEPPTVGEVTWRLSAEQAERLAPGAAPHLLLALAALMGGQQIPGTVFTTAAVCGYLAAAGAPGVASPEHAWDAVRALERTGVLALGPASAPAVVWISPAVAAQVLAVAPGPVLDKAARAAADALLETWPDDEPQPWLAAGLRSCTAGLHQSTAGRLWTADGYHPVFVRAGRSLDSARLTGPAATYWAQLTATSEAICGPTSPVTVTAGSYLARALLAAGTPPRR